MHKSKSSAVILHMTNITRWLSYHDGLVKKFADTAPYIHTEYSEEQEEQLKLLQETAKSQLSTTEYSVEWDPGKGITEQVHGDYLKKLAGNIEKEIKASIDAALTTNVLDNDLAQEIERHLRFCQNQSVSFFGRHLLLGKALTYFQKNSQTPLILHGKSGAGKTSLISALYSESRIFADIRLIRFCGLSVASSDDKVLLKSLIAQLKCLRTGEYQWSELGDDDEAYESLFKTELHAVSEAFPDKQIAICIDGLNELRQTDLDSAELNWIPERLPKNCFLVLSLVQEAKDLMNTLKNRFPADGCFLGIPSVDSDVEGILKLMLESNCRTLTEHQRNAVMEAVTDESQEPSSMLRLGILSGMAKEWTSRMQPPNFGYGGISLRSIITLVFHELEAMYGSELVTNSLRLLLASKNGLMESELLDVLSTVEPVLEEVFKYHNPSIRRIPPVAFAQLKKGLGSYLMERGGYNRNVLTLSHSQIKESALLQYMPRVDDYDLLARYFSGVLAEDFVDRDMNSPNIWDEVHGINKGLITELTHALVRGSLAPKALNGTVFQLQLISAAITAGLGHDLIEFFEHLERNLIKNTGDASLQMTCQTFLKFTRKNLDVLIQHPTLVMQQAYALDNERQRILTQHEEKCPALVTHEWPWLEGQKTYQMIQTLTAQNTEDHSEITLAGNRGMQVVALAATPSHLFASVIGMDAVLVWNIEDYRLVRKLKTNHTVYSMQIYNNNIMFAATMDGLISMYKLEVLEEHGVEFIWFRELQNPKNELTGPFTHVLEIGPASGKIVSACSELREPGEKIQVFLSIWNLSKALEPSVDSQKPRRKTSLSEIRKKNEKYEEVFAIVDVKFTPNEKYILIGLGYPQHSTSLTVSSTNLISLVSTKTLKLIWSFQGRGYCTRALNIVGWKDEQLWKVQKESCYFLWRTFFNVRLIYLSVEMEKQEQTAFISQIWGLDGENMEMARITPDNSSLITLNFGMLKTWRINFQKCSVHGGRMEGKQHICEVHPQGQLVLESGIKQTSFLGDNLLCTAFASGAVKLWPWKDLVKKSEGNTNEKIQCSGLGSCALVAENQLLIGGMWPGYSATGPNIGIWDSRSAENLKLWTYGGTADISAMKICPRDPNLLAYRHNMGNKIYFLNLPFNGDGKTEKEQLVSIEIGQPYESDSLLDGRVVSSVDTLEWIAQSQLLLATCRDCKEGSPDNSAVFLIDAGKRAVGEKLENPHGGAVVAIKASPDAAHLAVIHSCFCFPFNLKPDGDTKSQRDSDSCLVIWNCDNWEKRCDVKAEAELYDTGTTQGATLFWGFTALEWLSQGIVRNGHHQNLN